MTLLGEEASERVGKTGVLTNNLGGLHFQHFVKYVHYDSVTYTEEQNLFFFIARLQTILPWRVDRPIFDVWGSSFPAARIS